MQFAGGRDFKLPGGTVRSANLTSDAATGIGNWSEETFIARIRAHGMTGADAVPLKGGDMQTVMPWTMYAGMTDDDLKAIFSFLKTVPPKNNVVTKWTPAG